MAYFLNIIPGQNLRNTLVLSFGIYMKWKCDENAEIIAIDETLVWSDNVCEATIDMCSKKRSPWRSRARRKYSFSVCLGMNLKLMVVFKGAVKERKHSCQKFWTQIVITNSANGWIIAYRRFEHPFYREPYPPYMATLLYIFFPTPYFWRFLNNITPMKYGINTKINPWGKVISSCLADSK